jgi:hypothetical protein
LKNSRFEDHLGTTIPTNFTTTSCSTQKTS